MKPSHTYSIYPWLWQAFRYFFQQLIYTVTFSVKLLQNTGKSEGKKYWDTVFNSLFLGQTITDCVNKQVGKIK